MIEEREMQHIDKGQLMERVAHMRSSGYRLVQICPTTLREGYEMNYSFAKGLSFVNLRFALALGETLPGIGLIYGNAFLYENEIHDLFGIPVENMTVDYGGAFYRTAVPAPFSVEQVRPGGALPRPGKPAKEADGRESDTGEKHGP